MSEQPNKKSLKKRLLDSVDMQEVFNVKRGTVHNWCRKGIVKFIKIGGKTYFDANDVDDLIEKCKQLMVPGEGSKKIKSKE